MKLNKARIKDITGTVLFLIAMCCAVVDSINVGFGLHWHMAWFRIFYCTTFAVYFYSWGKLSVAEQRDRNAQIDAIRREQYHEQFKKDYEKFRKEMHGN